MDTPNRTYNRPDLNDRERTILRLVVKSFIDTAGPIGSRYLARRYDLGLSPASIRNTMSDLEERGYLGHPYTSAGRVPTQLGYRAYVDGLMELTQLTSSAKRQLKRQLEGLEDDTERLLRESSNLLGTLTNLLGVVLSPRLSSGVLERLEVVPLSSSRVMFVLSVRGGLLRTIVLRVETTLRRTDLDQVVALLNARLAGLTLSEIRRTCLERVRDLQADHTGIIELVLNTSETLFSEEPEEARVQCGSTQNIMAQPEFQAPGDLRRLIELLEDGNTMVHLLEAPHLDTPIVRAGHPTISIGRENHIDAVDAAQVAHYSVVTAQYRLDDTTGTIGVIGPMRMDYARVVALVEGMANLLSIPRRGPTN